MKNISHKNIQTIKYLIVFAIGCSISSMAARAAGTTTIETDLNNAIQYIKQVVVTSDGSQSGNIIASIGSGKTYFSGNVGIGTNSPQAKLDVNGIFRVSGLPFSSFVFPSSGQGFEMRFQTDYNTIGGVGGASVFQSYNRTNNTWEDIWIRGKNVVLEANLGGAGLVLRDSGNVGIGTNTPDGPLHVVGTVGYSSTFGTLTISDKTTPAKKLNMGYDGALNAGYIQSIYAGSGVRPLVINPNGGNVGIGTAYPQTNSNYGNLTLNGVGGGVFSLTVNETLTSRYYSNVNATVLETRTATPLTFGTNGIERMRIDGSGNVGIGTTNPQSIWDVYSNRVGGDTLTFKNTNSADYMFIGVTNNSNKQLAMISYGDTQAGNILGNARGGAAVVLGYNNPTSLLIGTFEDKPVVFGRNNAEAMRIGSSGKIGIGTTYYREGIIFDH